MFRKWACTKVPFGRTLYVERDDFMEVPVRKYFRLFPGNEVRLRGACPYPLQEVVKDADGNVVELLCATLKRKPVPALPDLSQGNDHWVEAENAIGFLSICTIRSFPDGEFSPDDFIEKIHSDSLVGQKVWQNQNPRNTAGEKYGCQKRLF